MVGLLGIGDVGYLFGVILRTPEESKTDIRWALGHTAQLSFFLSVGSAKETSGKTKGLDTGVVLCEEHTIALFCSSPCSLVIYGINAIQGFFVISYALLPAFIQGWPVRNINKASGTP